MLTKTEIASLIEKYLEGTISSDEQRLLREWRESGIGRNELFEELTDDGQFAQSLKNYHPDVWKESQAKIKAMVWASMEKTGNQRIVHRVHFLRTAWFRYAAAIIILFGVGAYLYTSQQKKNDVSSTGALAKVNKNDIPPGREKAVLTLSDGSTIILDSAANGQIAVQQGSSIIKKDGNILYDPDQVSSKEVVHNTMSTPRGGQYQLTLPDGTKVWLNAASSITYPTAFIEKQRIVKITGEVYFEVEKNAAKPFIVQTYRDEIKVLGTQFNVNAYNDEPAIRTSLSEGSVQVGKSILQPGQAHINGKVVRTNLAQDLAWKNSKFNFENLNVEEVMRQISRWYDIEVVYKKTPPNMKFFGTISRGVSLSTVLKALEVSGVNFMIEGKKLVVQ